MNSQKQSKTFFWSAVVFLAMVFAVVIVLLSILFIGVKSVPDWLKDYGGLIGSIFAIVIASYTIKRQSQNTREQIEAQDKLTKRQISAQREMEEERLFKKKIEEVYEIAFNLRIEVMTAKSFVDINLREKIKIFHSNVEKIIMLCGLYRIISEDLSDNYWEISIKLLDQWDREINEAQNKSANMFDSPELFRLEELFIIVTDELIDELTTKKLG